MERKWNIPDHHFIRGHSKRFAIDITVDLILVYAVYSFAFLARATFIPLDYFSSLPFISFAALITMVSLYGAGVYQRIWERTSGHGIVLLLKAVLVASVIVLFADLLIEPRPLPISVVILGQMLAFIGYAAVRYRSRLFSGISWRWDAVWHEQFPQAPARVLIVGAGEAGQTLAWRLKYRSPEHQYQVVGFIDDDEMKHGMYVEGSRILGDRHALVSLTDELNIDLIVVAVHNISGPDFREILTMCEKTKARIKVVPDLFEMMDAKSRVTILRDVQAEDLIGRSQVSRYEGVDVSPVTQKVILVTGAAGSIGSELSRQVCTYEPVRVILVDNNESGLHDLSIELQGKYPDITMNAVLADITNSEALSTVFQRYRPQVIFHAAAYKHVPLLEDFPNEAVRNNIRGTRRLAELACQYQVERFVLISTDKAVNPSSVMGASKRVCELLLHELSMRGGHQTLFTAVRFGNVLGSRGSVVPTFNRQIENGGPVTVTHAEMTRYFMSIPEAVNLVIHAACLTRGDEVFILKMGEVVRIVELAERMIRLRGLRPYQDIEIKFTGMRPGEKMHEELFEGDIQPIETLHPNIIQLETWSKHFDTTEFSQRLNALLDHPLSEQDHALQMLRQVIDLEYSNFAAAD